MDKDTRRCAGRCIKQTAALALNAKGDTLRATCSGLKLKVRLYCIDTPRSSNAPGAPRGRAETI